MSDDDDDGIPVPIIMFAVGLIAIGIGLALALTECRQGSPKGDPTGALAIQPRNAENVGFRW